MKKKYLNYVLNIYEKAENIIEEVWINKNIQSDYILVNTIGNLDYILKKEGKDKTSENIVNICKDPTGCLVDVPINDMPWCALIRTTVKHLNLNDKLIFVPQNKYPIGTVSVHIIYDIFEDYRRLGDNILDYRHILDPDNYGASREYLDFLNRKLAERFPDINLWVVAFDFDSFSIYNLDKLPDSKRY